MADAAEAPNQPELRPVEVDCEDCGQQFTVDMPRGRKVTCPNCGHPTLVPLQRAPVWFLAIAGAAIAAVGIPGLAYRVAGPWTAMSVAVVTLAALWWFGRRL